MTIQFLPVPAGMQRGHDPHQLKNGFCQHVGRILADAVHHHREAQLMQ